MDAGLLVVMLIVMVVIGWWRWVILKTRVSKARKAERRAYLKVISEPHGLRVRKTLASLISMAWIRLPTMAYN